MDSLKSQAKSVYIDRVRVHYMALCLFLVIFIHLLPIPCYPQATDSFKCVNIHKQPAFRHPKLKHHKLQRVPNIPQFPQAKVSRLGINNENGCRNGTVPIQTNPLIRPLNDINNGVIYHATISTPPCERTYRGGAAVMGVYKPAVGLLQSSRANIWVQNGPKSDLNSIEAGWAVHPYLYGDNHTRLTAYWTADNFQTTGCYNLLCPGFVQIDSSLFLGQDYMIIPDHPAMYDQIAIFQDNVTGNWWLVTQIQYIVPVGYWPKEIFTYLAFGADVVKYGGTTSTYIDQLDRPPMGSGYYPGSGFACGFFTRIRYVNESYNLVAADHSIMIKDLDSICYGLIYFTGEGNMKETIKFGGPGGTADRCKQLPPPSQELSDQHSAATLEQ